MYKSFFGLTENPFTIGPNPKYLYLSDQHRDALAHLLFGIDEPGGFVLLTGEVGTGKTTLCRSVLQQMPEDIEMALILNPRADSLELMQYICDELKIAYNEQDSLKRLNDRLNVYLLKAYSTGIKVVLLIDEAQQLSIEVLEQIRLLTNLETNTHKLLKIILIGQPELNYILASTQLRQLSQRITARYHLQALSLDEIEKYISNRLKVAGGQRQIFTKASIKLVHKYSKGIPRIINVLCDRCLLGAYVKGRHVVDVKTVRESAKEVLSVQSSKINEQALLYMLLGGIIASVCIMLVMLVIKLI